MNKRGIVLALCAACVIAMGVMASRGWAEAQGTTTLVVTQEQTPQAKDDDTAEDDARPAQDDAQRTADSSEAARGIARLPHTADRVVVYTLLGALAFAALLLGVLTRHRNGARKRLLTAATAGVAALLVVGVAPAAALDESVTSAREEAVAAPEATEHEAADQETADKSSEAQPAQPADDPSASADQAAAPPAPSSEDVASSATGDEAAQPTRTITFVANGPACDDWELQVPQEGGCFPECPFSFDRHEFVGWARAPEGTKTPFVPGEDLPSDDGDVFYAIWRKRAPTEGVQGYDFSSCRLIAALNTEPTWGTVLSAHDNVYLLGFEDAIDAAWAFLDYQEVADFVSPDIDVTLAAEDGDAQESLSDALFEATNVTPPAPPQSTVHDEVIADLSCIDEAEPVERGAIALIDTGVTGHAASVLEMRSVIDATIIDDNGHGTAMLETMLGIDPDAHVVSIRALDATGTGSASSVYAAIQMAIEMRVKVINLSLYAPATLGNEAVEQAIADAHEAGIIVVGAAGNAGKDAKWYVPGKMEQAVIVGSSNSAGERLPSSNFGATVDLYVPSASTSYAAARVSAWLAAHGTFGHELEDLRSSQARAALGIASADEPTPSPADDQRNSQQSSAEQETPAPDEAGQDETAPFTTAWTHPSVQVRGRFSNIAWCNWYTTTENAPEVLVDNSLYVNYQWQNIENFCVRFGSMNSWTGGGSLQYRAYYQDTGYDSWRTSPNQSPATTGNKKRVEGVEIKLTGNVANAYNLAYKVYTLKAANLGQPNFNSTCTDTNYCHHWFSGSNGSYAGTKSKSLAIEHIRAWVTPKSHTSIVQVRYQDANGNYGNYSNVINKAYQTGATVSWSRGIDATYNAASVSWTVTGAATRQVSVSRRTATNTIQVRYQNADGSYTGYTTVSSGSNYVGQVRSWSRAADATYKAASASITGTASNQTRQVTVERQTYNVNVNCLDPSGAETHAESAIHAALFDVRVDSGAWSQHCFNEPSGFSARAGQTVTIANVRIRPGLELKGVTGASSAGNGSYTATIGGATTISVATKLRQHSVSFNTNGGEAQGATTYTGDFGSSARAPSVSRAGFTFRQWVPVKGDDPSWVEVMYQSPMAAWFGDANTARSCNDLDRYARLGMLGALDAGSGWEFLLTCAQWPNGRMRWRQTSDPTSSSTVEGFEPLDLSWDAATFSGLSGSSANSTLACGNNPNGYWWYAVGAYGSYYGGVPVVEELGNTAGVAYAPLHLYVRSDDELSTVGDDYEAGYGAEATVPVRAYDQTLKAQWRRNRLTVAYDLAGGHSDAGDLVDVWEYGEERARVADLPAGLARAGYRPLPVWHVGSPTGPELQVGEELSAEQWAELAGGDLASGDVDVTLYAGWEQKDLRVVVPVALHYVAQPDGTVVGPDDGVAYVQNHSELPVRLTEARVEVYDPFSADLSLTVDKDRLEPGECALLSDLRGTMATPVRDECEVGSIHWVFSADET